MLVEIVFVGQNVRMTRQQTFLVTGFKKVSRRDTKRKEKKLNKNPFAQFYVNIICREDLELESRKNLWYLFPTLLWELHGILET